MLDKPHPAPIDDAWIAQLAAITGATDVAELSFRIRDLVSRIRYAAFGDQARASSDVAACAKRIRRAAQALAEAMNAASAGAKEVVRINLPEAARPLLKDGGLDLIEKVVVNLALAAGNVHPQDNPWAFNRRFFLEQLIADVQRSGGRITYTESGTLMRSLDVLKPHLPIGLANHMSFATVKRVMRAGRVKSGSQERKITKK